MVGVEEGSGSVVLEQRLQEHADGPKDTDKDKDPEEQAVDHHGNIFPVLPHLNGGNEGDPDISLTVWEGVGKSLPHRHTTHSSPSANPEQPFTALILPTLKSLVLPLRPGPTEPTITNRSLLPTAAHTPKSRLSKNSSMSS